MTLRPRRWSAPPIAAVDYELLPAAQRVIEGALSAVPGERLVIIADRERAALREALEEAARWGKVKTEAFVLDDFGRPPLPALPPPIVEALSSAEACIFVARGGSQEIELRRELLELISRHQLRHAHMLGVTARVMAMGLAVNPHRIAETARALKARLRSDSSIRLRSAAGTDLTLVCHPAHRWVENSGIIRPGHWLNLPSGELTSVPKSADGTYVCDASLTGLPGFDAELIEPTPLKLRLVAGRVTAASSSSPILTRAMQNFLEAGRYNDRVGLMSFGTNIGLSEATGSLIADQTLPGLHIALGTTLSQLTGAAWDSTAQLVLTGARAEIDVDGRPVMRAGRYLS